VIIVASTEILRSCAKRAFSKESVFVLDLSVAGGKKLVNEAKCRGRILFVGHVLKYHP